MNAATDAKRIQKMTVSGCTITESGKGVTRALARATAAGSQMAAAGGSNPPPRPDAADEKPGS
jgi:hypothetical protein